MTSCKFHGTLSELRAILAATAIEGSWRELLNGHHQFRTVDGGVLNWWSTTRTIHFQGTPEAAQRLVEAIAALSIQEPKHAPLVRLQGPLD